MEDPIRVLGRSDCTTEHCSIWCNGLVPAHVTYVHVPDTDWFIYDSLPVSCLHRATHMYCEQSSLIVVSAMVTERAYLIDLMDRCIQRYRRPLSYRPAECALLEAWKKELVLERIRRNRAARRVQKQFRESVSNPTYGLCKRRLLREFAEGI